MTIAYDLHQYIQGSSRGTLLAAGCLSFVAYLVGLAVYRLYLSPIAKFPGPKLAAVTRWYEFYYDVVLRGQYSNRIAELHKIYGELHGFTILPQADFGRANRSRSPRRAPCQRPSIPSCALHQKLKVFQGPFLQPQSRK